MINKKDPISTGSKPTAHGRGHAALVFGTLGALPFLETLFVAAHVGPGIKSLTAESYLQVASLFVLLWALMVGCFVVEQTDVQRLLSPIHDHLEKIRHKRRLKKRAIVGLLALPLILLFFLFGGKEAVLYLLKTGILGTLLLPLLELIATAGLIWLIVRILRSVSCALPENLRGAIDTWAFGLRLSIPFYLLLIAGTWKLVNFDAIKEDARLNAYFGIAKDYLLLFIIVNMLYMGLFKIARAERLVAVFQTKKGFLQFVLICGIIAVFAVWADFNSLDPVGLESTFNYAWQKAYYTAHVYIRDIGLLLLPIAGLLFWTLRCVADELREAD